MRGADMSSTHHERPAGVTLRFQVSEDGIRAASAERRDVLSEHPIGSAQGDDPSHFPPQAGTVPGEASAFACGRDILTGEAADDGVDSSEAGEPVGAEEANVSASGHVGPVTGEDVLAVGIGFDLSDTLPAGALEAKIETADTSKEGEESKSIGIHLCRAFRFGVTPRATFTCTCTT